MSRRNRKGLELKITLAGFLLICLFFLVSCDDFVLKNLLDGPEGARGPGDTVPLSISPSTITLTAGGSLTFTAVGGTPPYVFSVVSGLGSVNANTGLFVASITPGTAVVRVTDGEGGSSDATVSVSATGALAISPSTLSIAINNSITFLASGGVPPYTFSLTATGSGVPSVNAGTGLYTAGSLVGADQVQVEDSDAPPNTAVATINVTNIVTNVDYTILATNFPANATGGKAVSTGDFTIRNSGSAGGNQAVSWWVYISTDATLGSGDTLLCAGTTAALPSTGTVVIPLSGTWPLAAGIYRLFVTVDAADDLDPDTNGPTPITILAPDIDYTVTVVNNTGGSTAGGPIAGNFTVANSGADAGSQTVYWTAYVSLDDTPDGGDMVFATGTTGAIAGGGSTAGIPFSGTWPATAGNYYLVVKVSVGDDIDALNDYGDSGSIAVSDPPAPNVDYDVTVVNNTGSTTAAGPIAGNFTVANSG
ncbi:MAG TPA: hypothetical protein VMX75_15485, partial [Spirochaetia bacterium]|nr:hypothetical protein [Spirochaetia bacterium]